MKGSVSMRMKPARATRSGRCRSISAASAPSKAARSVNPRWSTTAVAMPRDLAVARPRAPGLLLITAATRAGSRASSSASMLLPRPDIRMTMDFPEPIAKSDNEHLWVVLPAPHDPADAPCGHAGRLEQLQRLAGVRVAHDRDHADTAVEHAEELVFRDVAVLLEPPEERRHL